VAGLRVGEEVEELPGGVFRSILKRGASAMGAKVGGKIVRVGGGGGGGGVVVVDQMTCPQPYGGRRRGIVGRHQLR